MDLVASRLAKDYKMKDKKGVKRLANNDSIKKKSAPNLEKSLKQKIKTNPNKISLKKKQLIKDTILDKNDKNKLILKENSLSKKTNVGKKSSVDISKDTKVTKAALKDNKSTLKDKLNLCPSLIPSIGNKKIGKDLIKNKKVKETKIEKTSLKGNKLVPKEKLDLPPIKISNNSDKVIDNGSIKSKKNKNSKKKIVLENQVTSVPTQKKSKKLKSDKSVKVKHVASEKLISTVNVESKNSNIQKQDTKLDKKSKSTNNSKTTLVKSGQTIDEEIKSTKTKKRKLSDSTDKPTGLTLKKKQVIQYVQGLKKLLQNEEPKKKSLFDSERSPVFMQLISIKVPKVPLHQLRITIPHSLLSPDDDVALIVKDLKRGRRVDFENTIHHYEDILQKNGCTRVKTVIPFNQLKTEYSQYEMKRRLFSSYDYFLIDGRIAGHVAHVLGTIFRKGRKMPTSIHMDKKNLKGEIEKALNKTCLQIHANGNTSIVQVGHLAMEDEKIADNILAVVENLGKNFPGGLNNVRSLLIKTPLSLAIPIYVTLKNKNEVEVPDILPKRPKAYKSVEGELSTFTSNVKVSVEPDGTVTVLKIGGSDSDKEISEDEQSENEADEVIQQKKVKSDEAVEEESEEED